MNSIIDANMNKLGSLEQLGLDDLAVLQMIHGLQVLTERFEAERNMPVAAKLQELVGRAQASEQRVVIAFVGLFSAGKSSLLGDLCGIELERGAVPTTAKVTELSFGTPRGEVVCLDTPGVDSTEPAHQHITDDALHAADIIVLVMDYQHVEAQENLELAETFSQGRKQLWIVVHQVDKHLDAELSFETFRSSVLHTFADWDIHYEQLFFTSVQSCIHNEFALLINALRGLPTDSNTEQAKDNLVQRALEILREHIEHLTSEDTALLEERIEAAFGPHFETSHAAIAQEQDRLRSAVAEFEAKRRTATAEHIEGLETLRLQVMRWIQLAQISPYTTTEKGKRYIESLGHGFSVGWFRSAKRIETERQQRLNIFAADIAEKTEQFLDWPVHTEVRKGLQGFTGLVSHFGKRLEERFVHVSADLCRQVVNEGALLSDTYGHRYVADVVAKIKQQCSSTVSKLLDEAERVATESVRKAFSGEEHAVDEWKRQLNLLQEWVELEQRKNQMLQEYVAVFTVQTVY